MRARQRLARVRAATFGGIAVLVMVAAPADAQVRERPVAERCSVLDPSCVPPRLPREFRGVWIASVANIDWPSEPGLPTAESKRELIALLDRAKSSGLNAVIFQVRPAADALYASDLEPWSEYLTGRQGVAPRPFWDPLEFAVAEAHKRGLELHAWFNPYRARHPSAKGPLSADHAANKFPAMVRTYGAHRWMDPGDETVRARTVRVILDVVQRYDIDGVHIDDYFYPYKERDRRGRLIEFPDSITYARYRAAGGMLARDDWRRDNVDRLVEQLYSSIHAEKPWVKFGVSPFGIWRPGFPAQIRGFDAYTELYADARHWLREGWVDYFSPQLYWSMAQEAQSYPALLRWWTEQNDFARHIWPGNYTNKVGEPSRTSWLTPEIEAQIDATRVDPGASGNIHFSAKVFLEDRDSLATRLGARLYLGPALVPASPWLRVPPQGAPTTEIVRTESGTMTLRVTPAGDDAPRWWLLQLRSRAGVWTSELIPADVRELQIPLSADRLAVRAIDKVAVEGPQVAYKW